MVINPVSLVVVLVHFQCVRKALMTVELHDMKSPIPIIQRQPSPLEYTEVASETQTLRGNPANEGPAERRNLSPEA
jgi:hypothetical protein